MCIGFLYDAGHVQTRNGVNMAINSLSTGTNTNVTAANYEAPVASAEKTEKASTETAAVVYEKGEDMEKSAAGFKAADPELVEKLKAEAEERTAQLRGLVEKMLLKQSGTIFNAEGLASVYRKLEVDDETRAQAQKDIAEDGYWGVEQTSDRLVDFAKALAGDDPDAARKMIDAIKEGYRQAEEAWGEELPEISKQTLDATLKKMNEWIKSLEGGVEETAATDPTQAAK